MSSRVDLGLGDLSDIKPAPATPPKPGQEEREERSAIDSVGRDLGFSKSAQPAAKLGRRKNPHAGELMHQISMKGPVSVMSRFIDFCDRHGAPYWQVLEMLMDKAEHG